MASLISLFLTTPSVISEGEILLGKRVDQVLAVSALPAVVEFSVCAEVRPDSDDESIEIEVSLEAEDFSLRIGAKTIAAVPRGDDWPFAPDVFVEFPAEVHVPGEGEAFVVLRLNGEVEQTKWLLVREFALAGN